MLVEFFYELREGGLSPSVTEYLTLIEALDAHVAGMSVLQFYYLARASLIKDEAQFDRFDQIFAHYFEGIESIAADPATAIPDDWLKRLKELDLSEEQKAQIESLGGWDELMQTLRDRLAEQGERHEGGNKWIGTAGRSPFGAFGYNPEGVRIGQDRSRHRRAVKVWDRREFADLDGDQEIGTRNIKMALRRLRRFAREGAADELDLNATIRATAKNAGYLDLHMRPARRNAVKLLIFFDVGGSMDDHVGICETLFSAARAEFQHLEYFYFHNFPYEGLWRDNRRRRSEVFETWEVCRTFGDDYKAIFVGDATMSPYEIAYPGGSVEHWNSEAGSVWLGRLLEAFPSAVWLNPEPRQRWEITPSIQMTRELIDDRMFELTLNGLDEAIASLVGRRGD
ncbi:VWA domain-containing protein [Salinisphaera sp. SPP-AMP-43]|uniref:vWA domain-containing protein n=1 Tax=Salinisphaera sp. SPP-AMP-43 TaxID=3121288 RepID=UPI003C6E3DD6